MHLHAFLTIEYELIKKLWHQESIAPRLTWFVRHDVTHTHIFTWRNTLYVRERTIPSLNTNEEDTQHMNNIPFLCIMHWSILKLFAYDEHWTESTTTLSAAYWQFKSLCTTVIAYLKRKNNMQSLSIFTK